MRAVNGCLSGRKCAYLDKRSTTTMMTFLPRDNGNPSTKSMKISVQFLLGMGSGCNKPAGSVLSDLQH